MFKTVLPTNKAINYKSVAEHVREVSDLKGQGHILFCWLITKSHPILKMGFGMPVHGMCSLGGLVVQYSRVANVLVPSDQLTCCSSCTWLKACSGCGITWQWPSNTIVSCVQLCVTVLQFIWRQQPVHATVEANTLFQWLPSCSNPLIHLEYCRQPIVKTGCFRYTPKVSYLKSIGLFL